MVHIVKLVVCGSLDCFILDGLIAFGASEAWVAYTSTFNAEPIRFTKVRTGNSSTNRLEIAGAGHSTTKTGDRQRLARRSAADFDISYL